jgi:SAM-dependent methyltransferase
MIEGLFRGRKPKPSDRVLDPGCGTGTFIKAVIRWCKTNDCEIPTLVGIESDPTRAEVARRLSAIHPQVTILRQDFLAEASVNFDFIVGNPPYVPITRLSETEKRHFRSTFETARGRFDLYLLFFERALKSLRSEGRLVFITPEKFLYVATAAPLRRLLSTFQIKQIRLVEEKLFGDLVTYPTITSVVRKSPHRATEIVRRDSRVVRVFLSGDGSSWMPLLWKDELPQSVLTLRDVCRRVSCGVATGADSVFVRPSAEIERALARFAHPTLAGRELIEPGVLPEPRASMLIPYSRDGLLLHEDSLGSFGAYLSQVEVRARLEQRTCVRRKPWYAFHETPMLREILCPKILCKDITQKASFWVDRAGSIVPRHSVYYIVPSDKSLLQPLADYLNSRSVESWLHSHCQRAANGFLRMQSSILKALPVPSEFRSTYGRVAKLRRRAPDRYPELPGLAAPAR